MKFGDFFKAQGLKVNKKTGEIDKETNEEDKKIEREKELKKMGYGPNGEILDKKKMDYDPINEKDYSYSGQYKNFEKKHEELYPNNQQNTKEGKTEDMLYFYGEGDLDDLVVEKENQRFLDNFENQESLESFIKTYEEAQEENGGFENEDILSASIKKTEEFDKKENKRLEKLENELSDYSDFEIDMFKSALNGKLDKKDVQFADGQKMSDKQVSELIDELKNSLPEEFVKLINRRLISEEFNWEKESFKNEKFLVSYFPDKKNALIKYVLKGGEGANLQKLNKVFVDSSLKGNKEIIKDKNGCILVFCSPPLQYNKQGEKERIINGKKLVKK